MTTGEKIRKLRTELGMTQEELGQKVGVKNAAIYKYESGLVVNLKRSTIAKLAQALGTTPRYLMGFEDDPKAETQQIPPGFVRLPEMVELPIIGEIACGTPITAVENVAGYDHALRSWRADFALVCRGDSMAPTIHDGDVVAIRKEPEVQNGQIAAVRIGDEATLKTVYLFPDRLMLQPVNPAYPPILLVGEEMAQAVIEGRAVGLCRSLGGG